MVRTFPGDSLGQGSSGCRYSLWWSCMGRLLQGLLGFVGGGTAQHVSPGAKAPRTEYSHEGPRYSNLQGQSETRLQWAQTHWGYFCVGGRLLQISRVWWVLMGHRVFLLGLGPREKNPPSGNLDNLLSRGSWSKGSGGHSWGAGMVVHVKRLLWCLWGLVVVIGHRICVPRLGHREHSAPTVNSDVHFFSGCLSSPFVIGENIVLSRWI